MTLEQLKTLWKDLGNTPINNDEELDEDFIIDITDVCYINFVKGTSIYDVWHWFDRQCPNNLHDDLMYSKN